MRFERLRMIVFVVLMAAYLYWLGVPIINWLLPTNLDGSISSIIVAVGIGLGVGVAPLWVLHRIVAGRW